MHILAKELSKEGQLQSAIEKLRSMIDEVPLKQGLILDINPLWIRAHQLDQAGLDPDAIFLLRNGLDTVEDLVPTGRPTYFDFTQEYRALRNILLAITGQKFTGLQPFLARIAVPQPPDETDDSPVALVDYRAQYDQLVTISRDAAIPTIVEVHPKPQLVSSPGAALMGTEGLGTLGGYLQDSRHNCVYGVTCGHVTHGPVRFLNQQILGNTVWCCAPNILPPGAPCTQGCRDKTMLDLALFETNLPFMNTATSIATTVTNGDIVTMKVARAKKPKRYEIGGHVIDYSIGGACWANLLQLHTPRSGIIHPAIKGFFSGAPKPGDSGSWILRNDTEWAGMVVATNHTFGFALPSTQILSEANAQFRMQLSLA